ncbi:MAG: hypothetical protein NZ530_00505 [Thermodesulfobacteriaceae bacterium]|nr:hypothetical protein [Thermodesulfobacteriaceae bacterium]MCX8040922.1 hypothetical protein [Thermodesulfobacteriaceae bacterium]MDW8136233.1 hypothetical protein [Thermodesulfobacterium sp.]
MKIFLKTLVFTLILFNLAFAKVKVGVYPVEVKASSNFSALADSLTKIILAKLFLPPQIEVFPIFEPAIKKRVDYFLLLSVWIEEKKTYLDYRLFKDSPSKPLIFFKEEVEISELESKVALLSEKIRERLYEESKPLWSKINLFKNWPKLSLPSFIKEKEKYRIEISIPSPPPPPSGYFIPASLPDSFKKSEIPSSVSEKPTVLNSPWQWF